MFWMDQPELKEAIIVLILPTNISDSKINHDDNDNHSHSVISISSSISSSSVCIIDLPSPILIPLVSPKIPVFDCNKEDKSSFYVSKYLSIMTKNNKKTAEREILGIESGKSKPLAWN